MNDLFKNFFYRNNVAGLLLYCAFYFYKFIIISFMIALNCKFQIFNTIVNA